MFRSLLLTVAVVLLNLMTTTVSNASQAVAAAEMRHECWQKANRQLTLPTVGHTTRKTKAEKRLHRLQRRLAQWSSPDSFEPDFTDPVDKWLWFGLVGLGAALVLALLFPFTLSGVVGFLAIICLVIWLVKRSGAA